MGAQITETKSEDGTPSPALTQEEMVRQGKAYVTERYGIWDILFMDEDLRRQLRRLLDDIPKSLPALYQLVRDVHSLSPVLFVLFCASQIWTNCQAAINLHFSGELLRAIEGCLKNGASDYGNVVQSASMRVFAVTLAGCISWYNERLLARMRRKIISHFEIHLMKVKLSHDLAKAGSAVHQVNVTSHQAWASFQEILQFIGLAIDALSQLTLIYHLSRHTGGLLFTFLCIAKPLISTIGRPSLWGKVCVVKQTNEHHSRMEALTALTEKEYRQDVISGGLRDYIINEYERASKMVGDISDDSPWVLYEQFRTPFPDMGMNILGDLPILYCALLALKNPKDVPFASIAILQESATSMGWSVEILMKGIDDFRKSLKQIRELYEADTTPSKAIPDLKEENNILIGTADATAKSEGMGFEFKDVSFSYPGSQTNTQALTSINLTIKPGQFVVLVGTNGSGKSTLVKLLTRLYQPPDAGDDNDEDDDNDKKPTNEPGTVTGDIFIDSLPPSAYTDSSLRQSMAILSQDNHIYPGFSLGENIGLGHTPLLSNSEAILEAAKEAGAEVVLKKMKDGAKTVLDPMLSYYDFNVRWQEKNHPLKAVLKDLRRPVEVSGGERQRIVAARTFMRFKSGKIRFLAVDEPSSALDAEAEVTLLENLLKEREGKTILFVTHRFGKLTRQADLIVCLKEGKIAESGTHQELMCLEGEYKKLYDVQAKAFQDDDTTNTDNKTK